MARRVPSRFQSSDVRSACAPFVEYANVSGLSPVGEVSTSSGMGSDMFHKWTMASLDL